LKFTCPFHKSELIPIDKYIWGCNRKIKTKTCPHIVYSPSELIDDNGKVLEKN